MEIDAMCAVGGDTQVRHGDWAVEAGDVLWINARPIDEKTEFKLICVKPETCPFREDCTGKVTVSFAGQNGFSKSIIHNILFNKKVNL